MTPLLISLKDVVQLTTFSGNIDADSMNPSINIAQNGDLKRIIGKELLDKLIAEKKAGTLSGIYKQIHDDYVVMILVFLSAMNYISFGGYKTANQGIFKTSAEGHTSVDYKEVGILVARYEGQAVIYEREFYKFMTKNPVPEFKPGIPGQGSNDITKLIPWY